MVIAYYVKYIHKNLGINVVNKRLRTYYCIIKERYFAKTACFVFETKVDQKQNNLDRSVTNTPRISTTRMIVTLPSFYNLILTKTERFYCKMRSLATSKHEQVRHLNFCTNSIMQIALTNKCNLV